MSLEVNITSKEEDIQARSILHDIEDLNIQLVNIKESFDNISVEQLNDINNIVINRKYISDSFITSHGVSIEEIKKSIDLANFDAFRLSSIIKNLEKCLNKIRNMCSQAWDQTINRNACFYDKYERQIRNDIEVDVNNDYFNEYIPTNEISIVESYLDDLQNTIIPNYLSCYYLRNTQVENINDFYKKYFEIKYWLYVELKKNIIEEVVYSDDYEKSHYLGRISFKSRRIRLTARELNRVWPKNELKKRIKRTITPVKITNKIDNIVNVKIELSDYESDGDKYENEEDTEVNDRQLFYSISNELNDKLRILRENHKQLDILDFPNMFDDLDSLDKFLSDTKTKLETTKRFDKSFIDDYFENIEKFIEIIKDWNGSIK